MTASSYPRHGGGETVMRGAQGWTSSSRLVLFDRMALIRVRGVNLHNETTTKGTQVGQRENESCQPLPPHQPVPLTCGLPVTSPAYIHQFLTLHFARSFLPCTTFQRFCLSSWFRPFTFCPRLRSLPTPFGFLFAGSGLLSGLRTP